MRSWPMCDCSTNGQRHWLHYPDRPWPLGMTSIRKAHQWLLPLRLFIVELLFDWSARNALANGATLSVHNQRSVSGECVAHCACLDIGARVVPEHPAVRIFLDTCDHDFLGHPELDALGQELLCDAQ